MRINLFYLSISLLTIIAAAVIISEGVQATNGCSHGTGATGNWCEGWATVSTNTGGVASQRCFSLTTQNVVEVCPQPGTGGNPSPKTVWQMDAGACVTLYWTDAVTGAVPPVVPNKVTIKIAADNSATSIITLLNAGTEPANGASYTFCATSTGIAGGAERAGTYRIYINPVKDNGAGGVGNYNIDSDGNVLVGAITNFDTGILIGRIKVASIARSAYPADATFSYGTAGDETATITSTFTQPNIDNNVEQARNGIFDSATAFTVGEQGTSTDVDATTLAQGFTIDQTFPFTSNPYVPIVRFQGVAVRTSLVWTIVALSGNGANIVRLTDNIAYDSTTFNINPNIILDSDGVGTFATADEMAIAKIGSSSGSIETKFNKGEVVYYEWFIFNSRGEKLSRAMTHVREDSANTVCESLGSLTPTANKYSFTSTLNTGATCLTSADLTGLPRRLMVSNTDQSYQSLNIFFVSSLLRFDQDGTGTPDNLIHECLTSCPSADITIFNRGETVDYEGYLINVRGTQYQESTVTWTAKDSLGATTNTQSITHSTGKYNGVAFTLSTTEKATNDITGDPHTFTATKNGNTANSANPDFSVSSLYFIDAHIQISATLNKDDYPTENANEDTTYTISNAVTDTTHGWCHVKGVRKDVNIDTSGSVITWSYIDPNGVTRLTGTTDTASDGWTPTHLDLLASTPLGTTWHFDCIITTFGGNSGTNQQFFTVLVPAGTGTGFPGDPLRLLCSPIIANPGETLECVASENNNDGSIRSGNAAGTFFDLYGPAHTAIVTSAAATEIGTTGQYYYSRAWGASPTLGSYFVIVRTNDVAVIASSTTVFVETDPTLALATTTQVNGVSTQVTGVATQVAGVQTSANTIIANQANQASATQVSGVATQVSGVQTSANTIIANQATAATQVSVVSTQITNLQSNNTNYHNHLNEHLHDQNITLNGTFNINNDTLNNIQETLNDLASLSVEPFPLLLIAVAFFVILGESRRDVLYWVMALILSIILLIIRPSDSHIPIPFFVGWIFIVLYQLIALLSNGKAVNLGGEGDE